MTFNLPSRPFQKHACLLLMDAIKCGLSFEGFFQIFLSGYLVKLLYKRALTRLCVLIKTNLTYLPLLINLSDFYQFCVFEKDYLAYLKGVFCVFKRSILRI